MNEELNQIRTFYINIEKTSNILRDYFGVETIFIDYKVDWKLNSFGLYEIFNMEILSVKKLNDQKEFEDSDFNIMPDNIQNTLKDAMRSMMGVIYSHDPNTPKICKKYSAMI